MEASRAMSPRRVTGLEEQELTAAAQRLADAEASTDEARLQRDQLIAELLDDNARASDIAAILGISHKAVHDARRRARGT